eukprot:1658149-Prorocentrum_lima.AAC.1
MPPRKEAMERGVLKEDPEGMRVPTGERINLLVIGGTQVLDVRPNALMPRGTGGGLDASPR